MKQQQYLIDTNAVIDYLGKKLPASGMDFMHSIIDAVHKVSVITKIEVLGVNAPNEDSQLLISFMEDATVLELTEITVDTCIEIRKNYRTKLPDAIIAATAIVNGFILISRNIKDFQTIAGLMCINLHEM